MNAFLQFQFLDKIIARISDPSGVSLQFVRVHMKLLSGIILLSLVFQFGSPANAQETAPMSLDSLLRTKISSAAKYAQTLSEAPASISIITSDEIQKFGYSNLIEVLQSLRGFYASSDLNYSYGGVRGFSRPTDYNNRLLVLIDGAAVNENVYGSAPLGNDLTLNMDAIERIEVVRGPGSVLYGTGAMFSVINIITKPGEQYDGVIVRAAAGTQHSYTTGIAYGKELFKDWTFACSAELEETRGRTYTFGAFADDSVFHGTVHDLDWEKNYGFHMQLIGKKFSIQGVYSWREKAFPTAAFETRFGAGPTKTIDKIGLLHATYGHEFDHAVELTLRASCNYYEYAGWYQYETEERDGAIGLYTDIESILRWDLNSQNRLILGLDWKNNPRSGYHTELDDSVLYDRWSNFTTGAVYLQNTFQFLESWSLIVGLRHDWHTFFRGLTTPRLGLVWNAHADVTLKALYGEAYRVPNTYERVYEDAPTRFKRNPDIEPERIKTLEFALEHRIGDEWFFVVSLYRNAVDRLIDQQFNPADSSVRFENINGALAYGGECEINAFFHSGARLFWSYSYQHATDRSTGAHLTNSPFNLVRAGLSVPVFNELTAVTECRYESERLTLQDTQTKASFIVDAALTARLPLHGVSVFLTGKNIFDVPYSVPAGYEHMMDALPQEGRRITLSVSVAL